MDPRHKLLPNPAPTPPVFCQDCKWYFHDSCDFGGWEECNAPINRKHTYLRPEAKRHMSPEQRNKNNKCGAFEWKITWWDILKTVVKDIWNLAG